MPVHSLRIHIGVAHPGGTIVGVHIFVATLFRVWQKKWGKKDEGSLEIDPADLEGTFGQNPKGQGGTRTIPGTTRLTMDTPL